MAERAPTILKFRSSLVPRQRGELARLRALKGPDRGTTFVLVNTRASIGRGEENDIFIGDLKASRLHAEITASATGWMVRDLGSANGILHNGVQTRSAPVRTGDLVTVGETVLEFLGADAAPERLAEVARDELQVDRMVQAKLETPGRARSLSDPFGLKSAASVAVAAPDAAAKQKKVLRLTVAALLALVAVFGLEWFDEKPAKKASKNRKTASVSEEAQDLESLLPRLESVPTSRNAEMFFKQGFREYRERNYVRALAQFELVLQLIPDHDMALRYRDNARIAIEEEVKQHFERGRKDRVAGKYRDSRAHYEAILRLLHTDQTNPSYEEARGQLEELKKTMEEG